VGGRNHYKRGQAISYPVEINTSLCQNLKLLDESDANVIVPDELFRNLMRSELEMTVVNVRKESLNRTRNLFGGSSSILRGLPSFKLDEEAPFSIMVSGRVRFVGHAHDSKLKIGVRACAEWSRTRILFASEFGT
jgi:hypothetical protein